MVGKIFIGMNYEKHYNNLIETRKNRVLNDGVYYEKHHIVPKSLGGDDSPNNIINLTPREHFIAHWLLWRIHRSQPMAFAFFAMVNMGRNQNNISSRIYQEAKESRRPFIIKINKKIHSNKKLSETQKDKISKTFKGIPKSESHREKISNSLKNKPKSDEHRLNLSKSLKNYDWSGYDDRNKKISESNSGSNNGRSRIVYQYDLNNQLLNTFTTMNDALLYYNSISKTSKSTFYRHVLNKKTLGDVYFTFILL